MAAKKKVFKCLPDGRKRRAKSDCNGLKRTRGAIEAAQTEWWSCPFVGSKMMENAGMSALWEKVERESWDFRKEIVSKFKQSLETSIWSDIFSLTGTWFLPVHCQAPPRAAEEGHSQLCVKWRTGTLELQAAKVGPNPASAPGSHFLDGSLLQVRRLLLGQAIMCIKSFSPWHSGCFILLQLTHDPLLAHTGAPGPCWAINFCFMTETRNDSCLPKPSGLRRSTWPKDEGFASTRFTCVYFPFFLPPLDLLCSCEDMRALNVIRVYWAQSVGDIKNSTW